MSNNEKFYEDKGKNTIPEAKEEDISNTDEATNEALAENISETKADTLVEDIDENKEDTIVEDIEETKEKTFVETVDETMEDTLAENTDNTMEDPLAESIDETLEDTLAESTDEAKEDTSVETIDEAKEDTSVETIDETKEDTSVETIDEAKEDTSVETIDETKEDTLAETTEETMEDTLAETIGGNKEEVAGCIDNSKGALNEETNDKSHEAIGDTDVELRAAVRDEDSAADKAEDTTEESSNEPSQEIDSAPDTKKSKKNKIDLFKILRIICGIGFVVFTALFINEVFIQPRRANIAVDQTRDLYRKTTQAPITYQPEPTKAPESTEVKKGVDATPTPDPTRDEEGRLLVFQDLLAENEDTKGWITIPDTNIDYVVMQNSEDDEYYLRRDFNREDQQAGTLFIDGKSSVEEKTQNQVIHGHNMRSTKNMFHELTKYKKLDFFKKNPTFTYDTIYQTGQWKIFSIFITNGSNRKEPFFDYTQSTFKDSTDFLNFIYQVRIRSIFNADTVDINENDETLTLSTCSYELNNYRLVIVARKLRPGEDLIVDTESFSKNSDTLYPQTYYDYYKKEAPLLPATFEEALEQELINWYKPIATE